MGSVLACIASKAAVMASRKERLTTTFIFILSARYPNKGLPSPLNIAKTAVAAPPARG